MISENVFISKCSQVSYEAALSQVVRSEGIKLIIATGYISDKKPVLEIYKKIKDSLVLNPKLNIEIYIGIRNSKNSTEEDIIEFHKGLLPDGFLELNEANRIKVIGVNDLHAKFSLMQGEDSDGNAVGIAATMGSSNLTLPALAPQTRIELDLFMSGGEVNELLQTYQGEICSLLMSIRAQEKQDVCLKINERIYEIPLGDLLKRMELIEKDWTKIELEQDIEEAKKQEEKYHIGLHE